MYFVIVKYNFAREECMIIRYVYIYLHFWWIRLRKQFRVRRTALQYNLSDILIKFAEIQQEWNLFFPLLYFFRVENVQLGCL